MAEKKLLCVDCYEVLEKLTVEKAILFYCNNLKCRRFGVLTVGGLLDAVCEKGILIENKESILEKS
jgi:hypothetical protein